LLGLCYVVRSIVLVMKAVVFPLQVSCPIAMFGVPTVVLITCSLNIPSIYYFLETACS